MRIILALILLFFLTNNAFSQENELRQKVSLESGWKFSKGEQHGAEAIAFNDSGWESVDVPHDWAIYGPFDLGNDEQNVAITQNFEKKPTVKTGRTGALPYVGVGWYRTVFDAPTPLNEPFEKGKRRVHLLFDGAMSEAQVFVNGKKVGNWPCGYNSFHFDVTEYLNENGNNNTLAVRLENRPKSSRWYPGAGLYRNVHVITTHEIHVPIWGTYLTTPTVSGESATVNVRFSLENLPDGVKVLAGLTISRDGETKAVTMAPGERKEDGQFEIETKVWPAVRWSPESPTLYEAALDIFVDEKRVDRNEIRFGFRDVRFEHGKGFSLNGEVRKFQGVCNHHDLGPLGAAVNEAALRRQLTLLKDMGCDAIRTAHNMPAPELIRLCDEMGFMAIVESFDEWNGSKCENGYHRFFKDWAEKDMVNMVRQYRNHPSVVLWSIGNEVPNQWWENGHETVKFLQDICHREDPSRLVTCGMDQVDTVTKNGFAAALDLPGFNYRVGQYKTAHERLKDKLILGAETASTVSSRGVYKFPVQKKNKGVYDDYQCSSYDVEYCPWSNIPDEDFAMADDNDWAIGQFVWTGFDYLGEPTPYDGGDSSNHSSMFGIIDLASIPKDRFYLYRSRWNKNDDTLHILPHWNWEGREGETTPVFVYTNQPTAELFLNGKIQGKQSKDKSELMRRYRLMWKEVKYEPGELRVVAYDSSGKKVGEKTMKTAGVAARIELVADRTSIAPDGKDLSYVNVRIVDQDGNLCPCDNRSVSFKVSGAGTFRAVANGDPTSLELFHEPKMQVFNGQLTAIVQAGKSPGTLTFEATAEGLPQSSLTIRVTD